ncbi:MAG TPA: hypothetical protein DF383_07170, partial [Deltaproteobacteria bacterium]|nr:hypothetical protein [Deltaproteobacteria bacterium]
MARQNGAHLFTTMRGVGKTSLIHHLKDLAATGSYQHVRLVHLNGRVHAMGNEDSLYRGLAGAFGMNHIPADLSGKNVKPWFWNSLT